MVNTYRIWNGTSGVDLGLWRGENERGALDEMARAAGYDDYDDACSVAPGDDVMIEEVNTDTDG